MDAARLARLVALVALSGRLLLHGLRPSAAMTGPHLVLLMPCGSGWQLRVYFRRTMASRSRCHTSWFRERSDACESMRVVMR